MTGFEFGSSGIGSNRAANCATTTVQRCKFTLQVYITLDKPCKHAYTLISYEVL